MKALLIWAALILIGLVETIMAITNEILLQSVNTYFLLMFTTRNGLFFGVLFVAMGMALADLNQTKTLRHPFIKAAVAFVLLVAEAFTVRHFHWALDYNMYLMTVPFILYLFAGLLQTQLNWKLNFKALREASTVIYFCHAMFLELGEILLGSLYLINGAVRFFFVFPLTMILTVIIRKWLPFLK
ncbi:MAG: acyltransferase family protein [Holdemania massiliensis]